MRCDRADAFAGAQQIVFLAPGRRATNASIQISLQLADFLFKPVDVSLDLGTYRFRRGMDAVPFSARYGCGFFQRLAW